MRLKELCDALRGIRGVHQLQLVTTTALLPPLHEQDGLENKGTATSGKNQTNKGVAA
jgi:CopG family nickel-responsive transcriptional regulator